MDFRDYTYIKAIAEYKTLSKAAEMLYISEPSLSKYLRGMEAKLQTPLFRRVHKELQPTYAGELVLKAGSRIREIQNQLNQSIEEIAEGKSNRLNIAVTSIRGLYILPRIYPELQKSFPELKFNIFDCKISEIERKSPVEKPISDCILQTVETSIFKIII